MNSPKSITLDDAVIAAKRLPAETQAELAQDLMQHVEDLSTPHRPKERQAIIRGRLARPLEAVSRDDFMRLLRQYDPDI